MPKISIQGQTATVIYKQLEFKIPISYYEKLKLLYEKNAIKRLGLSDSYNESEFVSSLFSLICRYESYFNNSLELNEGYGMQSALPWFAFEELN